MLYKQTKDKNEHVRKFLFNAIILDQFVLQLLMQEDTMEIFTFK